MNQIESKVKRVAFLGDYSPRKCGIATFTKDLYTQYKRRYPDSEAFVVAVTDIEEGYDYPYEVRYEFAEQKREGYRAAADFINLQNPQVVCLQHEYGIYGGDSGEYLLDLISALKAPIITTLHTVLEHPSEKQRQIIRQLALRSSRLVVMADLGRQMLRDIYQVEDLIIDVVPHGIPDIPFLESIVHKTALGLENFEVLLTFGLISPNKGIENVIRALPRIVENHKSARYVVVGVTHPNLIRHEGEKYREGLVALSKELGVEDYIIWINRFVDMAELKQYIASADVYITPYGNQAQITSGTLAYTFGSGKPVISTPYYHATELLADNRGILVPFNDSDAIGEALIHLLDYPEEREAMALRAYEAGRKFIWPRVMEHYQDSFQQAELDKQHSQLLQRRISSSYSALNPPPIILRHLINMTDHAGIFQHATHSFPRYADGYCTDDNARALIASVWLEQLYPGHSQIKSLRLKYIAWLNYAWNPDLKLMRNFMAFNRDWLDDAGSDDCQGRTIWALGELMASEVGTECHPWAYERILELCLNLDGLTSPRSWAFILMGLGKYLQKFPGHRLLREFAEGQASKLMSIYQQVSKPDWPWIEESLSYDNASIALAFIRGGQALKNNSMTEAGLRMSAWLFENQTSTEGYFEPVGSNGFWIKGAPKAKFDQQPLEAAGAVLLALECWKLTQESQWSKAASVAFGWFLGNNSIGECLVDLKTGACRDALHADRLNANCGAESSLAWLMALSKIYQHGLAFGRAQATLQPELAAQAID